MGSLVLTRKVGQAILIEHGIVRIEVVSTRGHYVRLRFTGNCQVDREERYEEYKNKNGQTDQKDEEDA